MGGTCWFLSIVFGLILFMAMAHFGVKYYVLSKKVKQLNAQVTDMVKQVLTVSPKQIATPAGALKILQSEENKAKDRLNKLADIRGISALDIVKEISTRVPARKDIKLDVEDINIKGERMSLSGRTDSFIAIDKIKAALEGSKYFRKVTPSNVGKGIREGEVKFEMSMDIVPKGEES